jgi:hypothetical protein
LRDSDIAISGLSWIEREAAMANPTGESESDAVRLDFDRRLMLQFRGSVVTSDVGLCVGALDTQNEPMATADSWRGIQLVMRVTGGHAVNPQSGVADLQRNAPVLYRTKSSHRSINLCGSCARYG